MGNIFAIARAACDPKGTELCNPLTTDKFEVLVNQIATAIFKISIPVAVLMVVIGGIMIMTAGGSSERVTRGRKMIIYALVGLVVVLLAAGLVSLIQDILGVTPTP